MKTKKSNIYAWLFLLLSVALAAPVQAANDKDVQQTRKTSPFHGISVSSGIDLYLTQGNSEAVVVKADPDIIDDLVTEVDNGILKIYMKKHFNWTWNRTRKVEVTFVDLTKLDVSAGADVKAQNAFRLDDIDISVSSGADLKIEDLTAKSVSLDVSSGADARLSGQVDQFKGSSSSGANLHCGDLVAESCVVSASSGADADVHVTKDLKARASSGGDVRYKGNPSQKDIDESSGGDVNRF